MHYTARCCPALFSLNRAALHFRVSREMMWVFFDDSGPPHVFLVWLWRVLWSLCNEEEGKKKKKKRRIKNTVVQLVMWSKKDRESRERETERERWLLLKITALSFSASTLEFTVFHSLYATATLHWRSVHSQSPWVLILSVLPIWRQTTAGKAVNSYIPMCT